MATQDTIINITSTVSEAATPAIRYGRTGFYTQDLNQVPFGAEKELVFTRFADVIKKYPADSEPYKFARSYFSQQVAAKPLVVVRHRNKNVVAYSAITGENLTDLKAANGAISWTGIFKAAQSIVANTSATTHEEYAEHLEEVLNRPAVRAADVDKIHVRVRTYGSNPILGVITLVAETTAAIVAAATVPSGAGMTSLGFANSSVKVSHEDETAAEAITGAVSPHHWVGVENGIWEASTGEATTASNLKAIQDAVVALKREGVYRIKDVASYAANAAASSVGGIMTSEANQSEHTGLIWSLSTDYPEAAIMGQFSAVDFRERDSMISIAFKPLHGIEPDVLTPEQRAVLDSRRINYYVDIGGEPGVYGGWTTKRKFYLDTTYAVLWYENEQRFQILSELRTANKISLDADGATQVYRRMNIAAELALLNGIIAPGVVEDEVRNEIRDITDTPSFSGVLTDGYLVYIAPFDEQDQSEREERIFPKIYTWSTGSGAANGFTIANLLEQ